MHRVVQVALRVPRDGEGLDDAAGVGRPRPDFVITLLRELQRRLPVLPGVGVGRFAQLGPLPGCAEVHRHVDPRHLVVARPCVPGDLQLAAGDRQPGLGRRDQRFHRHGVDDPHGALRHLLARRHRIVRHPVGAAGHLRPVMHLVAQPDPLEPFLRAGARPAGDHQAQRRAVHRMQRPAVHAEGDQVARVHRLADRHAARDRQLALLAGEVRIRADMGGVDDVRLDAGGLEHVGQAHAGPVRAGDRADRPLVAARRRVEEGPAVAAAFDGELLGHDLELLLQVVDAERHRAVDQAVDAQLPGRRVHVVRHDAVVADEVPGGRRDRVVEQMGRGLGVDRPVVEHGQPVLALDGHFLGGDRLGDEARRHVAVKRDRRADQGAHAGEAGAFQEPAAVRMRLAPEHDPVGLFRVFGIEFEEVGCLGHIHFLLY